MADTAQQEERGFSPPYNVPFSTFQNTVEKVAADLPNKVDRSYLSSRSGSEQSYLISAFRGFGLIDDNYFVTDALRALVADTDGRQARIAALLEQHYPEAVALGRTNATPGELETAFAEMFPRVTGASRVKAMRFFLHAAEYAGVQRSPLWKAPKVGVTGTRRSRARRAATASPNAVADSTPISPTKNMKQVYFDLLIKKAESQDQVDAELLDRIERLLGESKD